MIKYLWLVYGIVEKPTFSSSRAKSRFNGTQRGDLIAVSTNSFEIATSLGPKALAPRNDYFNSPVRPRAPT